MEHARRRFVHVARSGDEADQVLDQRLGHRGVDVVVRHLIADPVGAPAERQLGEVAGADHEPAVLVGEPEQIIGAQARLHVLEGDVVDFLVPAEGMADVLQHLRGRGADVEFLPMCLQRLHQRQRIGLALAAGGKARHGVGKDVFARQAE